MNIVFMVLFWIDVLLNLVMMLKVRMRLSKDRIIGVIVFMIVVEVFFKMCNILLSLRLMVVLICVIVVLDFVFVSVVL